MRRRRLPLAILVPAGTLALVCTLAVLQYQWLGRVSEAEADQLRASLDRNAHEFAADFDHEVSSVYVSLQRTDGQALAAGDVTDFARRFDAWREASRFPELVDAVYFSSGDRPLHRYDPDARAFNEVAWPDALTPVRARLNPTPQAVTTDDGTANVFEYRLSPMLPDVPAVVVPVYTTEELPAGASIGAGQMPPVNVLRGRVGRAASVEIEGVATEFHVSRDVFIVTLDAAYLRETMLPTLAQRHFPQEGADRYRLAIVDREGAAIAVRPADTVIPADEADIVVPFFGLRVNAMRATPTGSVAHMLQWAVTRADGTDQAPARVEVQPMRTDRTMTFILSEQAASVTGDVRFAEEAMSAVRLLPASWQIRVQHADGSLEAAVANARTRNLWLSFGMLALLMASVALVVVNAQRSERLAARQMDFVATVSHELRTPLAVIRSAAQNLQAGVVLDREQARRYGDLIEDEGRRLTDMVEQVLEYAGLSGNRQPVRARPVDVRAVTTDAVEGCRSLIDDEGFEVSIDVPADLPPVLADEEALRRAVQNLVTNALKYAADGRWLGISAERTSAGGRGEVRVSVADRGRGIDAEDLPHIFEPFYRGRYAQDRQIHGNGLGLSLVRRIAEAHGGRLTVKSAPGQGSTFTLHLPVASGESEPVLPMTEAHRAKP